MSHKPQKQRFEQKRQLVEFDDEKYELLMQCIASGQVEPSQIVAHVEAGELNQGASDGRNKED